MKNSNYSLVGLKALRENINTYIKAVEKGQSFIVVRRSKPVLKISSPQEDEVWERVADFTTIKESGISARAILKALRQLNA